MMQKRGKTEREGILRIKLAHFLSYFLWQKRAILRLIADENR